MTFSIIIPAHNAQKYISRCLNSCLSQSYSNLEIIIINDASTDNTQNMLKNFKDPKIKVISNHTNLGPFASRIQGAQIAQGDYVLFVDSDDYLQSNTCETLAQTLANQHIDILHFGIHYANNSTSTIPRLLHLTRYLLPENHSSNFLTSQQEIIKHFFITPYHFPRFSLWDKVFSRKTIQTAIQLSTPYQDRCLIYAEDALFLFLLSLHANSYLSIPDRLYVYTLNSSSTTQSPLFLNNKLQSLMEIKNILKKMQNQLKGNNFLANQRLSNIVQAQYFIQQRFNGNYLQNCKQSLKYWKRSITYIYLLIYYLTFGKVRL